MFCFKKSMLAILTAGTTTAIAGTMGPVCQPTHSTIPCTTHAWDIGIDAVALRLFSNNSPFSTQSLGRDSSGVRIVRTVDNDLEWGFKLQGAYHFNTGNDLNLNWLHWNDGNKLRSGGSTTSDISGNNSFDVVNAELGQIVNYGLGKNIRFHGGLQYATMESNLTQTNLDPIRQRQRKLDFQGVGPRLGADMGYELGRGFSVYANGATALLIGKSHFTGEGNATSATLDLINYSENTLSPEIEGKVGLSYTTLMSQGTLIVDIGYMAMNYFSPLRLYQQQTTSSLTIVTREHYDFGLSGPYVGLKWSGNL